MDRLTLRPVTAADLDVFEAESAGEENAGVHQWFGFRSFHDVRRRFAETGLLEPDAGVLTAAVDDAPVGRLDWFKSSWGRPDSSWCWTIAVGIRRTFRAKGFGTEAQRLLVAYLFAHTRAERVQAFTDIENVAEQMCLEKIGFTREGVLRSAQWRNGSWHDQVLYSTLRSSTRT